MAIKIINHSIVLILILLFLLCTLEPVKRLQFHPKFQFLKSITKYHSVYAWLLLILSLVHGFLAENTSASISGKIVWMILLLLIVFAYFRKKCRLRYGKQYIFHVPYCWQSESSLILHMQFSYNRMLSMV